MKTYYTQHNVGRVKYAVSFHNGTKTHSDGSPFFDLATFRNKKEWAEFTGQLQKDGYACK